MGIVLHHDSHTTPVRQSLFSPPRPVVLLVRRVTKITHLRLYCDKQSLATGPEGGRSCRQLLFLNTFSGPEYHMLAGDRGATPRISLLCDSKLFLRGRWRQLDLGGPDRL